MGPHFLGVCYCFCADEGLSVSTSVLVRIYGVLIGMERVGMGYVLFLCQTRDGDVFSAEVCWTALLLRISK